MKTVGRAVLPGLVLVSLACSGCGPSAKQEGGAILIAAPFVLLTLYLVQAGLLRLWSRVRSGLDLQIALAWGAVVVLLLVAVLAAATVSGAPHWADLAFYLWGTSAVTTFAIVFRLGIALRLSSTPTWAPILGVLPGVVIGWLMAFEVGEASRDVLIAFALVPGWGGAIAGPVLGVLFIEGLLRVVAARSKALDDASTMGEPASSPAEP